MTTADEICAGGSGRQSCSSEIECQSNGSPVRQEIFHKSSKEFYKAVAAQWGITCKMSDHCRCLDCQVKCDFQKNIKINISTLNLNYDHFGVLLYYYNLIIINIFLFIFQMLYYYLYIYNIICTQYIRLK